MSEERGFNKDIFSVVAHDLRIPITAARLVLELLPQEGSLTSEQMRLVARIAKAIDQMEHLADSLQGYASLGTGLMMQPIILNLNVMILDVLDVIGALAEERGIRVLFDPCPTPPTVYADEHLLLRVLYNLLMNSINYNHRDGQVRISVSVKNTSAQVDVSDTGDGLHPEDQRQVFERFYRAPQHRRKKINGTGLGLAICREIIEQHQGRIWVESIPGHGATFSFALPLRVPAGAYRSEQRRERGFTLVHAHPPSESMDGVDDSQQESNEFPDAESKRDEV